MHTNCVPGLTILDRPELEQELHWLSVTGTDSGPPPASSPDPPGRCTEGHLELGKSACFQFQESRFTSLVLPSFRKGNPPTPTLALWAATPPRKRRRSACAPADTATGSASQTTRRRRRRRRHRGGSPPSPCSTTQIPPPCAQMSHLRCQNAIQPPRSL